MQFLHNMDTPTPKKRQFIIKYLNKLGFDATEAALFLTLSENGPMTILQASRTAHIERTKLYRIAEGLSQRGLIEEQIDHRKRVLQAVDLHTIELLINEQELSSVFLKDYFSAFSRTLQTLSAKQSSPTKVLFYRGKEGIKQMLWNELDTRDIGYAMVYKIFEMFVGEKFFVKWVEEFQRRNIRYQELRTEIFDQSFEESPKRLDFRIEGIDIRYLSSIQLPITHSMSIYNNVVAMYNWWEGEIFGVEIYNQQIADMQRIFFKTFWEKAKVKKDDRPTYYFFIK